MTDRTRDVTFPVQFHGDQHYAVRFGAAVLPMYFAKPSQAEVHLRGMIYRRRHDGEMPEDLEKFADACTVKREDREP